jgi:selenocysteine-specific elongation factor
LRARAGLNDGALGEALRRAVAGGGVVDAEGVYVSRANFDRLARAALEEVEGHHRREPLSRGIPRETLRERLFAHAAPELFRAVVSRLEAEGAAASEKDVVRAGRYNLKLSPADAALRERLEQVYAEAALEAPTLDDAIERAGGAKVAREHARKILQLLLDDKTLLRVQGDLFFHRGPLERLVARLREHAAAAQESGRTIDVATFKEIAGVSRKYAIPLLEYLDRERVTRRAGDKRIIL